jgi:hypothetical protein
VRGVGEKKVDYRVVRTQGFKELPLEMQVSIIKYALSHIDFNAGKPDMIVLYPCDRNNNYRYEDDGRTLVTCAEGLDEKVFVILSDFGDPEKWGELYGYDPDLVERLRKATKGNRYIITFMLADEY